jgi:hypothetical protein
MAGGEERYSRYTGREIAQMARELNAREGVSARQFLDMVYPYNKIKSPEAYLRNLASGRTRADAINRKAQMGSGDTLIIRYSANDPERKNPFYARVTLPLYMTRLDLVKGGGERLREAADQYLEETYADRISSRRERLIQAMKKRLKQEGYSPSEIEDIMDELSDEELEDEAESDPKGPELGDRPTLEGIWVAKSFGHEPVEFR